MEQKPRFLIYSRREMAVLIGLAFLIAFFAFTYGLHLGKRVTPPSAGPAHGDAHTPLTETAPDPAPNRQEVDVEAKGALEAGDESMSQALRDEVTRTGLRVDVPKAVKLPKETRAEKQVHGEAAFTLQLGVFATVEEAKAIQKEVTEKGVKSVIRPFIEKGKPKQYRVLSGGFASRAEAEDQGKTYIIRNLSDTFVVVPNPDRK